jgi:hypothetical protein
MFITCFYELETKYLIDLSINHGFELASEQEVTNHYISIHPCIRLRQKGDGQNDEIQIKHKLDLPSNSPTEKEDEFLINKEIHIPLFEKLDLTNIYSQESIMKSVTKKRSYIYLPEWNWPTNVTVSACIDTYPNGISLLEVEVLSNSFTPKVSPLIETNNDHPNVIAGGNRISTLIEISKDLNKWVKKEFPWLGENVSNDEKYRAYNICDIPNVEVKGDKHV